MRTGDWIKQFNITVKTCEERPDKPQGDIVYRVKDIFTTRDGSWEPSSTPGAVNSWARNEYLKPWGAADYFDDAGADHHLFAKVLDLNGKPIKDRDSILYWSDGFNKLGDPNYKGYVKQTPKEKSGWSNIVCFSSYVPERNEIGPWSWCPVGAADVVVGGGMPANWHVSVFAVWQAEKRSTAPKPTPPTPPTPPVEKVNPNPGTDVLLLNDVRQEAWRLAGVNAKPDSAFANYARAHGLGVPLTGEYTVGGVRAQGFHGGIVYSSGGNEGITHAAW